MLLPLNYQEICGNGPAHGRLRLLLPSGMFSLQNQAQGPATDLGNTCRERTPRAEFGQQPLKRGDPFHQCTAAAAEFTCVFPWVFCAATQESDTGIMRQTLPAVLLSPMAVSLWE